VWEQEASDYNCRVYSAELLDHFQNPRNAGEVEKPNASVRAENPACGDILELSMKVEEERIVDIRFRAKGCVPSMACGSAITELANGRSVEAARTISREDVLREVGGVPEASSHAAILAIDALRALLRKV
jgi:nitrogen fixation protein NifU and related proteins